MRSFRILILGLVFTGFVGAILVFKQPLVAFFRNIRVIVFGAADPEFSYENWQNLKIQNGLLAQISAGTKGEAPLSGEYRYKIAGVFSDYPFNNYGSIIINAGADDGLKIGMPVLAAEGILIGRIKEVKKTQSEAATIFDPNWRSAAAFGPDRVKVLLVGGPAPYLDLVPKEAVVNTNDAVFNLAKDFPLYLNIGKIIGRNEGEGGIWSRVKLEPPISFENLKKVLVITDFP